jgi:hypothetical protein
MLELFQEWGSGGQRRFMEGLNSTMIYCKNFYKYHNVLPVQKQQ